MVEVDDKLLLETIDGLKASIAGVKENVNNEAHEVAVQKNWNEDLEHKFADFLLANDERFDIVKQQEKLDLLQSFVKEVPDVEQVNEVEEVQI